MLDWIQNADQTALNWIAANLRMEWLNPVAVFYTSLGNGGWIFILVSIAFLLFRNTRKAGLSTLSAMLLGLVITNLTVKPLVARLRPWMVMEELSVLIYSNDMNSFPSGHTCAAFAFAVALCVTLPQKWVKAAALIAAALMGFSRLYVGVHFPSDVLAGALLGSACGLLGAWIADITIKWFSSRKAGE